MSKSLKIGLALGGGGARGAAHIGVLQVLHDYGISIDSIAGTSAGAIMGAMYAATLDPYWMEERYRDMLASEEFKSMGTRRLKRDGKESDSIISQIGKIAKDKLILNLTMTRKGIIDRDKLEVTIRYLLPVRTFKELKIHLNVVSTDLNSGTGIQYTTGNLIDAVVQSSSIPGYVRPILQDNQLLMDGGVSTPLPINSLLKSEVDFTIAVDISRKKMRNLGNLNMLDILARSDQIQSVHLADELAKKADFIISPDVKGAHWSSFQYTNEFIENGRIAAEEKIEDLKKKITRHQTRQYQFRQWLRSKI